MKRTVKLDVAFLMNTYDLNIINKNRAHWALFLHLILLRASLIFFNCILLATNI